MPGYLEGYGAGEETREKRIKWIVIGTVLAAILGTVLYFSFRNFRQESAVNHFLDLLRDRNYPDAYRVWGCTSESPCRDYAYPKFLEDWGPKSPHADVASADIDDSDACGTGVVVDVKFPKAEPVPLFVTGKTNTISFAPWPECPGRHFRLMQFLKSKFK
jgi:hypothetical protein